jgi:hypothetical protein
MSFLNEEDDDDKAKQLCLITLLPSLIYPD